MKKRAGRGRSEALSSPLKRATPQSLNSTGKIQHNLFVFVVSSYFENRNQVPFEGVNNVR